MGEVVRSFEVSDFTVGRDVWRRRGGFHSSSASSAITSTGSAESVAEDRADKVAAAEGGGEVQPLWFDADPLFDDRR